MKRWRKNVKNAKGKNMGSDIESGKNKIRKPLNLSKNDSGNEEKATMAELGVKPSADRVKAFRERAKAQNLSQRSIYIKQGEPTPTEEELEYLRQRRNGELLQEMNKENEALIAAIEKTQPLMEEERLHDENSWLYEEEKTSKTCTLRLFKSMDTQSILDMCRETRNEVFAFFEALEKKCEKCKGVQNGF
jgi:hypothetical protein